MPSSPIRVKALVCQLRETLMVRPDHKFCQLQIGTPLLYSKQYSEVLLFVHRQSSVSWP